MNDKDRDSYILIVKRWHHTSSTAIVSYIFNTFPNLQLARDWTTGIKSAHRQQFELVIFECLSHLLSHYRLKPPARWSRRCFTQVITALIWAHNLLKGGTTLVAQLSWVIYLTLMKIKIKMLTFFLFMLCSYWFMNLIRAQILYTSTLFLIMRIDLLKIMIL